MLGFVVLALLGCSSSVHSYYIGTELRTSTFRSTNARSSQRLLLIPIPTATTHASASSSSRHLPRTRASTLAAASSVAAFFFGEPPAQKQEGLSAANIAASILGLAINAIVRLSIGAFGRNDVKVSVTAASNVDALWGRWKRLDVQVANAGRWIRVKSARASGRDLDLGVGLTRQIAFFISILTGTCWTFLGLYLIMSLRGSAMSKIDDARKPCAVDWAMALSADGMNKSSLLRPFFQIILDTLMQNSVLVAGM
jgi:hypothetical protein